MRGSRRWSGWALPLSIAVASTLLAAAAGLDARWHDLLDYRRADVAAGQAWRLATAHLMHLSTEHAALDIVGLLLVAWIFSAQLRWREQATVCVVAVACIDAALWLLQVDRYVGLSGVLHAWFAAGAVGWLLTVHRDEQAVRKRWTGAVLCVGLVAKLALEARHQAFWLDGAAFPVVTAAHRWGAVAGIACGLGAVVFRRRSAAGAAGASRDRRARGCRAR